MVFYDSQAESWLQKDWVYLTQTANILLLEVLLGATPDDSSDENENELFDSSWSIGLHSERNLKASQQKCLVKHLPNARLG